MNICILTEGGKNFGFGHITRCLSISEGFQKRNLHPKFIVNGDSSLNSILKNINHIIINWETLPEELFVNLENCNLLIIDSIEISDKLMLKITELNLFIVMIDDYNRKGILKKGMIVDWTILAEEKNFHKTCDTIAYLLGSKYTPLRKEFNIDYKRKINSKINNILISFGGSDVKNMTPKILKFLNTEYSNIKKTIIVGSGFSNVDQINKECNKNTKIIREATAQEMCQEIITADIAIASGGQTLYELARLNLPTITITLVDNQIDDIKGWEEACSYYNAGWYDNNALLSNLKTYINLLQKVSKREEIIEKTKKHLSNDGANLLVESILKNYHNDII
ncbi:UDP-2,4-diacetamido-2,4,6-trideoxy-beta-L-altropyranose hydrolase [Poseidonibacter sp.]|uniref:UDP-2,4-diacetamido-2,4, 6-trideoxy-beta-L-altropyranose hydrolase n=1 Tax=Poseidonibacter sp. TaxID=2321188 RepID=UPI003C744392